MAQQTASTPQQQLQQNALARSIVLANAVDRMQQISTITIDGDTQNVFNIAPRNVGLIKGFFVDIEAEVTNAAAAVATLTKFGPANILKQIVFTDLQNNTRIQTAGWHLAMLNTARANKPFGMAQTFSSAPIAYGNIFDEISAPATLAASAAGTIKMRFYVPLAYSSSDLRGAVFANVVNATMNLQLTINNTPFQAAGDATLAVYSGNSGTIGNVTITVYQHYLDQIPTSAAGYVLPMMDLSTFYSINNSNMNGLTVGQDFPVPYANYRSFLSTFFVYDNAGAQNAGTDLNYIALQSANFTNIFKMSPIELALLSRVTLGADYPAGTYYVSHRNRPINTNQYGNIELIVNPSTVGANSQLLLGYESFGQVAIMSQAGSLPGGG
jgi:hypothetical protein